MKLRKNDHENARYWVDTTRELIDRETRLRNNRITWMLTSQTILFLAFSNLYANTKIYPSGIIALLGCCTNITFAQGLRLCTLAVRSYKRQIEEKLGDEISKYPPFDYDVTKDVSNQNQGSCTPWKTLPYLFGGAWFLLLLIVIIQQIPVEKLA